MEAVAVASVLHLRWAYRLRGDLSKEMATKMPTMIATIAAAMATV